VTIAEKYNARIDALWEALTHGVDVSISEADHSISLEERKVWNARAETLLWCLNQVKVHLWPLRYPHARGTLDETEPAERAGRN